MIGSALAMQVGSERYALTVAIDYSGDTQAVREIVSGIADYLHEHDRMIARQLGSSSSGVTIAKLD